MNEKTKRIIYILIGANLVVLVFILFNVLKPDAAQPVPTLLALESTAPAMISTGSPAPLADPPAGASPTPRVSSTPTLAPGNFFVSPDGSPQGDGSQTRPWDLQTALSHPDAVQPGNTIWLRGGRYVGGFTSYLKGQAGMPVIMRQYPGERAVLDGDYKVLTIAESQWVDFWGFEITNSANTREVTEKPGANDGVFIDQRYSSNHINFINLTVHDLAGMGFAFWKTAVDSSIYGSIIYYNGVNKFDHGIYTQNQDGQKILADNMIFNNASHGIHAYSSEDGFINNYEIRGNTVFDNGFIGFNLITQSNGVEGRNILVGGNSRALNEIVAENITYLSNGEGDAFNLGYNAGSKDASVTNNYFMGGGVVFATPYHGLVIEGNTLFAPHTTGVVPYKFLDNTWLVDKPTQVEIFVRPNQYEPNRANVTVFNWPENSLVYLSADDLGEMAIQPGDSYLLRNVQDYFQDVISGVYDGNAIPIRMSEHTVAQPVGMDYSPPTTFPRFGAFVLEVIPESP